MLLKNQKQGSPPRGRKLTLKMILNSQDSRYGESSTEIYLLKGQFISYKLWCLVIIYESYPSMLWVIDYDPRISNDDQ